MPKLTYINNMSVDGYVEDRDGHYNFGPMSDDVFAAYTDLLRPVSTYLYGRRLYETMAPLGDHAVLGGAVTAHLRVLGCVEVS